MRADAPRINLAQVAAETRALLRRDGNYRRTALTVALMQTLISVPVMILNYALMFTGGGVAQDAQTTMNIGNLFMMLMQALVAPALTLGLARYELNMYNGRPRSPMDLFEGLTRGSYFLSVRAMLWRALSMLVWVMIPMSLVLNEIAMAQLYGQMSLMFWPALLTLLFLMLNRGLAYSQQFYFLAHEPRVGAIMSLKLSTMAMHGRLKELFCLYLRFFYCFILIALPDAAAQVLANKALLGLTLSEYQQVLLGVGVALATILLTSLCMPLIETASAVYFVKLNELMARHAEKLRRAREEAFNEAAQSGGSLPGWGDADADAGADADGAPDANGDATGGDAGTGGDADRPGNEGGNT